MLLLVQQESVGRDPMDWELDGASDPCEDDPRANQLSRFRHRENFGLWDNNPTFRTPCGKICDMATTVTRAKGEIFISYKRNVEPDNSLAARVFEYLQQSGHTVFIDRTLTVGQEWAKEIEAKVRRSDALIVFLTAASSGSEMVKGEVEIARDQAAKSGKGPRILPVRVAFAGPLPYPLSAWLDPLQFALWRGESDTPSLLRQLLDAVVGVPLDGVPTSSQQLKTNDSSAPSSAAQMPTPGGTVAVDDPWYIERSSDALALHLIRETGRTITIKGPRQMGKSSLLMRVLSAAVTSGKKPVFLDFQMLDVPARSSGSQCYRRVAAWIAQQLELPHDVDTYWDTSLPDPLNCTRFLETKVLNKLSAPITIAIDEADSLFDVDFRSDFFGMLRSWHNARGNFLQHAWKNMDLILVTSTDPYFFVDRVDQSPFNVGEVLTLLDFSREQVAELNHRHGYPLTSNEVERLTNLLGGHPYLTQRALYVVGGKHPAVTPGELFGLAFEDSGPFGDHLRSYVLRLHQKADLAEAFFDVVNDRSCKDEIAAHRLMGAGLVRREKGRIVPRCHLYGEYFRQRLGPHE